MRITAFIVTLVCCCLMFFVKRETKAALLVMGAMTLTPVFIPIPLHWANFLLQAAFLLSEWNNFQRHFRELRRTPYLKKLLLLVSVSALIAGMSSPFVHLKDFLQSELLFKYFALAYAFWAVKDEKSLKPILRISLYCLIVLTIFGVLNYMDKSAMFINALTEGKTSIINENVALGDLFTDSLRFRTQSMFVSPFDYGYICAAVLLLHLYARHRGIEKMIPFIIVVGCCLFGIFTCGCRVVWVCSFLSVSCFYLWCFPLDKTSLAGIMAVSAFILSYSTVEYVEEKVDNVTDIFRENPETQGSNIEMRLGQFAMVWYYIEDNKLLGLGEGYWAENFKNNPEKVAGLQGVESVILHYLLERGFVGLIIWIVFYTWLFRLFWKNRQKQPFLTGLGTSVLVTYIFYAVGTGELGSVYPTMLLLGLVIKAMEYKKRERLASSKIGIND